MATKKVVPLLLSDEQQEFVRKNVKKHPDISWLTCHAFKNEELKGSSREGRAIRQFLLHEGLGLDKKVHHKRDEVILSKEQKEFLLGQSIERGMNTLECAKLVYKDPDVVPLSQKHRATLEFLKTYRPEILNKDEIVADGDWAPPHALSRAIMKVNNYTGTNYDEVTMPVKQRKMCERLLIYLKSPRFIQTINQLSGVADRELFEGEFVRATWDKPDLSIDELNLYITLCSSYIRQKNIQKRLDRLEYFLNQNEEKDVTMRFTELIKVTSAELTACEKGIQELSKSLQGTRGERIKRRGEESGSMLALVEAFQNKEERDRIVRMAEIQNKLIKEEAENLESMDEFKARIFGISKEEIF